MNVKQKIKRIIGDATNVFVVWQTSYNYTTKTSRKRGGYSRVRTSKYFVDENGVIIKSHFHHDELTGVTDFEIEMFLFTIPIPNWFMNHPQYNWSVVSKYGQKTTVEQLKYCKFYGTRENANYLASFGDGEPSLTRTLPTVDCRYVSWLLFFPYTERLKHWQPSREITILDEQVIQDVKIECQKQYEHLKLIYEPKYSQMELIL